MSWTRVVMLPRKWPRVMTMYDVRECPICLALVFGKRGQAGHQHHHDEQESGGEVVVLAHEGSDDDD
jgi:hypothetical protein